MSGKRIIEGLKDAVAYLDGSADKMTYVSHVVQPVCAPELIDIKSIRQKMGLTQAGFAASFGLSLYTLRGWEQGKRKPDPAVRA
jgi:putative transcriptional regulator